MNFIEIYHFYLKKQKLKKDEKLVANIYDEKNMSQKKDKQFKQALSHRLVLKNFYTFIKFNQEIWLKPYSYKDTELKKWK